VEGSGESFELAVGYSVDESDFSDERDVDGCELVGAFFPVVHSVEFCLVVL